VTIKKCGDDDGMHLETKKKNHVEASWRGVIAP
jgi:hypothetical protein